ncbi:MAG TPA: hypothetical protein EYP30_08960 [Archaeoglobaceae archaeon]|nr:hypothetical protein [Archaeoglobaceae archaeon]
MKDDVIKPRVERSVSIHSKFGERILSENNIRREIEELKCRISSTKKVMDELGVTEECRKCASRTGSCCGKGIENRYSEAILLINLMLGVKLPMERETDGCFFLGEKGCKLIAREVLCVNYLCDKITQNIELDRLIKLQNVAGEELDKLFQLINKINLVLRGFGND